MDTLKKENFAQRTEKLADIFFVYFSGNKLVARIESIENITNDVRVFSFKGIKSKDSLVDKLVPNVHIILAKIKN